MKICTYCGQRYPDDAIVCPIDSKPLSGSVAPAWRSCPRWIKVAGMGVVAVVAFLPFAEWWLFSYPVSDAALQRLTPGMAEVEVQNILGKPCDRLGRNTEREVWVYMRFGSLVSVTVFFDDSRHYQNYFKD